MTIIDGGKTENPDNMARWKAPRWCDDCEVGQSVDRCWWCAGPTRETGTAGRRVFNSSMRWRPVNEPDHEPLPGYRPEIPLLQEAA